MRKILTYGGYFEEFLGTLRADIVRKIDYGIVLLKSHERLPAKFVKYIEDGLSFQWLPKEVSKDTQKGN